MLPHRRCRKYLELFLCGIMSLFLWQASFFPALVQGNDKVIEKPIKGTVRIVIPRGETIWGLAKSHNTTVAEIVKLNKVKSPDKIREGASLLIPSSVVEEKPETIEDIVVTDNTVKRSWWTNALQRRFVQVGSILPRQSTMQLQEPTIITYEIFVNKETPEPLVVKPLPEVRLAVEKPTVLETAAKRDDSQINSRSLGRLVSVADVEILTRVIHGEARGENFEGQVAVGAVVLNRVKDPRFPKTIRAVVYQSGAFTAVDDKQIQLDPNDQSYKAAEAALSGQDPTNGAIFYYNPRLATDRWIKSRAVVKQIGNHTFSI